MSLLDGSCVSQHCLIAGPCYRIIAVVDGLLCGLVGKIVVWLEENCKRLWGDGGDREGVGCGVV